MKLSLLWRLVAVARTKHKKGVPKHSLFVFGAGDET